jgi:hypothetical protein
MVKHSINLKGNGAYFDSYDSSDPTKSSNGLYNSAIYAGDHGDIATDGTSTDGSSVSIANANIYGAVQTGPGCPVSVGSSGGVGTHAWQATNTGFETGFVLSDANYVFPSISLPQGSFPPPVGGYAVTTNINLVTTTNYYSAILLAGSATKTNTLASGLVLVRASSPPTNATLILTGGLTGNENFVIEQGARLVLYCDSSISLSGNQINTNGNPASLVINATTNVTSVTLKGNGTITGVLVAPSANVTVSTGGNNPVAFCGALLANSFNSSGNFAFHYDEALSASPVYPLPPQILSQPQSQEVVAGQNASFSVSMSPGSYSYYLWYFGANSGSNFSWSGIPGPITRTTLTLANVDQTDVFGPAGPPAQLPPGPWKGAYYVTISTSSSVLTSAVAFLTVHFPPSLLSQPFNQSAIPGSSISLSVAPLSICDYPWSFQWRLNGTAIPGATNTTLLIPNVNSNNVGNYDIIFSNPYGSVTSQKASVTLTTAPDYLWARGASNCALPDFYYSCPSSMQALAITTTGQPVVAGTFSGPGIALDPAIILTNYSTFPDYFSTRMNFLCQYDASGCPLWGVTLGRNSGWRPMCIGVDGSNDVFVAGGFSGSLQFGTNALVPTNNADMFVGKWGPGSWARLIQAGDPPGPVTDFGFAVDPDGNVFIASRDAGTADFGSIVLTNSSGFLAKYDNAGNLLWATEALPAYAIALGTNGSIYLVGQPVPYGPGFLAKYDTNANLVWSRAFPVGLAVATDAYENLYVTGWGAGTYDGFTITNAAKNGVPTGAPDFFVAKCDSSGHILWLKQAGSINGQAGMGICVDRFGDVFVSSLGLNKVPDPSLSFDSITITNVMGFVAEFDYQGRALSVFTATAATNAAFSAVAGSSPDAIYASGGFYNSPKFGNCTLTNNNLYPYADPEALLTKLAGISPDPTAAQLVPHAPTGSQFQFDLSGTPGFPYVIESSTNLTDWLRITTNLAPSTFTTPSTHPFNYYRAVYRP